MNSGHRFSGLVIRSAPSLCRRPAGGMKMRVPVMSKSTAIRTALEAML